jgi:FkbM family methyltransferase
MNTFYGQFAPPVDRFIFERYFPEPGIQGVFVECGAFDGLLDSSCKFFEETMAWKGFNLEPVPWIFESLCRNRPLSQNLNIGLSDKNSDVSFKQAISPILGRDFGNGSICHAQTHLKSLEESGCTFEEINISVITWREFVTQQKITHVDLFVLDVEGHELSVIDGMQGCNVLPDVMCVEFGHIGLDIIRDCLAKLGYIYDISSNGNAYFVQKNVLGLFILRRAATLPTQSTSEGAQSIAAKKEPLAFIHIMKCSGTSFENYLTTCSQFKGRCSCFTGVNPQGEADDVSSYLNSNASSPFVFGHIPYAGYERSLPNALFATFLRDPVQRTISHYKSWHDPKNFHPEDPHYIAATQETKVALMFSQKATLEEFIKTDNSIIRAEALGNIQTMMLSSRENVSLDVHLESAKENLAKCVFFGLTEKFEESISIFQSIFLDAPAYALKPTHENRSRVEVSNISSETMDIIREQVSYDILLYEYAKSLFEERKHTQFAPRETFLLADLGQEHGKTHAIKQENATQAVGSAPSGRERLLEEENQLLHRQIEELTGIYKELAGVYTNIVHSKGWRAIEAMRSVKTRFHKK